MKVINVNYLLFILLSSLTIIISKTGNNLLNIEELYYQSLTINLSDQQIDRIFEIQKKIQWLNYIVVPIIIAIKTILISSILYIGLMLLDMQKISFNKLWNIVLQAEFIFAFANICKIVWFYIFKTTYNLQEIQYFYPLSLLNIIDYSNLEIWFIYLFQVFNLFELSYIIFLAYRIGKSTNTNTDCGLKLIGVSYIPVLFLWVATVMFFTLNYS